MRKSTLITTIAMIVVVVVALSTATFAWFSSATNTIATANVSTTANADWAITKAAIEAPAINANDPVTTKSVTFNGSAKNSITLDSQMLSGLFAPSAVLATAIAGAGTTANVTGLAEFYEARIDATGATATCTALYDGKVAQMKMPDVIRVSNAKPGSRTLMLNIVINVGTATDNISTLLAGSALRFYIEGKYGATPTSVKISNSYEYKTSVAKDANFANLTSTTNPKTTNITAELTYSDSTDQWAQQQAANEALGINANEYVKIYSIEIGEIAQGQAANFVIYTWLDGWKADAAAAGANFTIKYAFTTKSTPGGEGGGGTT